MTPGCYAWRVGENGGLVCGKLSYNDKQTFSGFLKFHFLRCPGLKMLGRGSSRRTSLTSFAERNNLNIRMHSRRMTRLTNAFSKKVENHAHAMALHFMYYNFVRIHRTLRTTPAMAAGITKRLWEIGDILDVLESWQAATLRIHGVATVIRLRR